MTLDLITISKVWHIGSMDPSKKRKGSYEGAGLSVSVHPAAWSYIGRGIVSGDCWKLKLTGAKFLDAHETRKKHETSIMEWAQSNRLVEPTPIWTVKWFDDELDDYCEFRFDKHKDAIEEAESSECDIQEISGFKSTAKLLEIAKQDKHDLAPLDLVIPIWAESQGVLGVWWADNYSPQTHSAPRGVISPKWVEKWEIKKVDCPDDENI